MQITRRKEKNFGLKRYSSLPTRVRRPLIAEASGQLPHITRLTEKHVFFPSFSFSLDQTAQNAFPNALLCIHALSEHTKTSFSLQQSASNTKTKHMKNKKTTPAIPEDKVAAPCGAQTCGLEPILGDFTNGEM